MVLGLLLAVGCQSAHPALASQDPPPAAPDVPPSPPQEPVAQEPTTARARKTDVVVLGNGDRLTGEIKELARGKLELSTYGMDTVYVEWDDVVRVTSRFSYRIELSDGGAYVGRLLAADQDGTLVVEQGGETSTIGLRDVVWITQAEEGLVERFNGYVNAGFSYTKASDVTQLTFGASIRFDTADYGVHLQADAISTREGSASTTDRLDSSLGYVRYLGDNYFAGASVGYELNDELGVDGRSSLTGGGGRYLIRNNAMVWSVGGGLRGNREDGSAAGQEYSLEGVLTTEFRFFLYDTPKSDILFRLDVFPSLTDTGRWRAELDTKLRQELVDDFFLDLSFYASYDSDPLTATADNDDYGLLMSVGYSF